MYKRTGLGIIGTIVVVFTAIVGTSVLWAAYTSNLVIRGSATAQGAKWSIIFRELGDAEKGNTDGFATTAIETSTPSIEDDTSIEDIGISVKTPGDYVSYTFKIKNNGDFPAKIGGTFKMPVPECTVSGSSNEDSANVCANLTYTLEYTEGGTVSPNDNFDVGAEKEVKLTLTYLSSDDPSKLPKTNVDIGNLDITIPFVQQ